jgi:hypothetical protein
MMAAEPLQHEFIPCLSDALRHFAHGGAWLQYAPCVMASIGALAFFHRHRERWDWATYGPMLLAISIVFAPYAWITDQVLLLPAVWQLLTRSNAFLRPAAVISTVMAVQFLCGVSLHSAGFLWAAPTWLLVCLYGSRTGIFLAPAVLAPPQIEAAMP